MVPETVFYMDIEEAGTVRGGVNCFFFLKSFEKTWNMFSTGYSFKREDEECRKF